MRKLAAMLNKIYSSVYHCRIIRPHRQEGPPEATCQDPHLKLRWWEQVAQQSFKIPMGEESTTSLGYSNLLHCLTSLTIFFLVSDDNFSSSSCCPWHLVALSTALLRRVWHYLSLCHLVWWPFAGHTIACPWLPCTGKPETEPSTLDMPPQCWAKGKTPFSWPTGNARWYSLTHCWLTSHSLSTSPPRPFSAMLLPSQSALVYGVVPPKSCAGFCVSQCWRPQDSWLLSSPACPGLQAQQLSLQQTDTYLCLI